MITCDQCRELVWDQLYGLLEPAQGERLLAHLAECRDCGAELAKAQAEQRLVAEAARLDISIPAFTAPASNSEQVTLHRAPGASRNRDWAARLPWLAAAAAILASVFVPHVVYQAGLARREQAFQTAELRGRQNEEQRIELRQQAESQIAETARAIREKQLHLQFIGPADVQKGKSEGYHVRAATGAGNPADGQTIAQLKDNKSQRILFEAKGQFVRGEWNFSIPADLVAEPKTAVHVEVVARGADHAEAIGADLRVREPGYVTHLAINQRVYRPGETVFFRSLTLGAQDQLPSRTQLAIDYHLNFDGKKAPILSAKTQEAGIAGGEFVIPTEFAEGEYTLIASGPDKTFSPVKRRFVVQSGKSPVRHNALREAAKQSVEVEFFPEGGDLVAGITSRVYFRVRDGLGKSADLAARLIDSHGREAATLQTNRDLESGGRNYGLGVFSFTPQPGEHYRLQAAGPGGTGIEAHMPEVRQSGIAITIPNSVAKEREPVRIQLHQPAPASRAVMVAAYNKGLLVDHREVALSGKRSDCELLLPENCRGAIRITVLEPRGQRLAPVAERLVYRIPEKQLALSVRQSGLNAHAGGQVEFEVNSADEQGRPKAAWLLVSVLEQSFVSRAGDPAEQAPPALFYLTSDVDEAEELEHADFLVGSDPRAGEALDLFLGAYGWRRLGGFESAELASALVLRDNLGEIDRKSHAAASAALAKVDQEFAAREKPLIDKRAFFLAEMRQASQALTAYQGETPELIGKGSALFAFGVLLTCGVYGGVKRLRRALLPRSALAGGFAALFVGAINLYWFSAMSDPARAEKRDQQIAWVDHQAGPTGKLQLPQSPSLVAVGQSAKEPSIIQPSRNTRSHPLNVPDGIVFKSKEGDKNAPPAGSKLSVGPLREFARWRVADKQQIPVISETIYWTPALLAANGSGQFKFDLPGSPASCRVRIEGHSADGRLGSAEFRLDPKPVP